MEITHRANKNEAYAEGFKNKDKLLKETHGKYRRVVERYILLLLLSKQIEEGVEKMFGKIKILRAILKRKNAQIRAEREKYAAERAANAIIAASREQMLGATLYMCCTDPQNGEVVGGMNSCMMCKRQIINAGIDKVVIRNNKLYSCILNLSQKSLFCSSICGE